MSKLKIKVIRLGTSRHKEIWDFLDKIKEKSNYSKIFEITEISKVALPPADSYWSYSDASLKNLITPSPTTDFVIGILDQPLNDNYFAHRINYSTSIISLHQIDYFFSKANVKEINYLLLMLYESVVLYYLKDKKNFQMYHDDTRSCLFDMCGIKEDIIQAAINPCICWECEAVLRKTELPNNLLENIKSELKRIKKPLFYRIRDLIKKYPVTSLIITILSTIFFNIISCAMYDLLKSILN